MTESNYSKKIVVYDIETIKCVFTAYFKSYVTGTEKYFVISQYENNLKELIVFLANLKSQNYYFVGFNNLTFDNQVIDWIFSNYAKLTKLSNTQVISLIYKKAQELIAREEPFPLVSEDRLLFKPIDIFKQKHYDGKAKRGTSLKWLQFSMGLEVVKEMPISHDIEFVTQEQIKEIIDYNRYDVISTYEFFIKNKFETDLRFTLSELYNINLLNASEPGIVKKIFAKFLCEEMKITPQKLKELKTPRDIINVKDIVFPYISFETQDLKEILKSVKLLKLGKESKFKHDFTVFNIPITIGLGGIHGCVSPGIYKNKEGFIIEDVDVIGVVTL